jgi:hypothetical protein
LIYTHAVAAVLALAVGFGAGWRVQGWRHAAATAEALEVAAETARLRQQAATQAAERNDRDTNQALARARAAALDARGDLERLRIAAGAVAADPAASAAGCSDDGRLAVVARLLTEGAGLVEEGGRRVEQLAAEKAALQRHAAGEP